MNVHSPQLELEWIDVYIIPANYYLENTAFCKEKFKDVASTIAIARNGTSGGALWSCLEQMDKCNLENYFSWSFLLIVLSSKN